MQSSSGRRAPAPGAPGPVLIRPKPGYVWNPLKKDRNIPCPCLRGRKAKHCCGRLPVLPKDVADKVTRALEYEGHR